MKTCPVCHNTYPDRCSACPEDGAHLTAQATEIEAQLAAGLSRRTRNLGSSMARQERRETAVVAESGFSTGFQNLGIALFISLATFPRIFPKLMTAGLGCLIRTVKG